VVSIAKVNHSSKESGIRPRFAVVFHEDSETNNIVCATQHQVNSNNTLSLGRVVSAPHISKAFSELNTGHSKQIFSCVPETVLHDSSERLVWYKRRFIGSMWFRVGSKPQHFTVEWPSLLFIVDKAPRKLRVFALSSNARPTAKSRLYHAPLMNVDVQGVLCQGTATLPNQITIETITQCENTIFDSQFTHVNHEFTLRKKTSNKQHVVFWKRKSKTKSRSAERVSVQEMKFTTNTLGDIMQGALS
jgi:PRTRC genetic system protein B